MSRKSIIAVVTMLSAAGAATSAHVGVAPRDSAVATSQRYTVRVPTEGQVATVSVELEIPAGVTVTDVPTSEGVAIDLRRNGGRIVAITWAKEIRPQESAEFVFVAQNPTAPGNVVWRAHQRFADGTTADWIGAQGDRRPAAVTRITGGQ